MAVRVYRNGFKAELIGRMKTAVHAYTSPEISPSPVCAKIPEKVQIEKVAKCIADVSLF